MRAVRVPGAGGDSDPRRTKGWRTSSGSPASLRELFSSRLKRDPLCDLTGRGKGKPSPHPFAGRQGQGNDRSAEEKGPGDPNDADKSNSEGRMP